MRDYLKGKRCMIWSFMGNSRMFQALNQYGDRFDTVGIFTFEVDITGTITETGTSIAGILPYPKTGRAFRMVQALDEVYKCADSNHATALFDKLYTWLRRSRLEPMKRVALTLRQHKAEILAYFFHRLTNAIAEGINSIIQAGKRKARGFRTFRGFSTMIYLACAKLDFAPVSLFPSFSRS